MTSLLSNPPYNMAWDGNAALKLGEHIVPKQNANYAFILRGLELANNRAVFLLPNGALTVGGIEGEIRKGIIEDGHVEAVISFPGKMFESTDIPVTLLVLNHDKKDRICFIDASKLVTEEIREQKGQYGSAAHTNRVYKKTINVLKKPAIDKILECLGGAEYPGVCKWATLDEVEEKGFLLQPRSFIDEENASGGNNRSLKDIVQDLNRIRRHRNVLKLTVNETLAKKLGIDFLKEQKEKSDINEGELGKTIKKITGERLVKENWITFSKRKNELKFENNDPELLSEMLCILLPMWKSHLMYLNNAENQYLAELRDTLLPLLMTGELDLDENIEEQA
ncbi:N-6 DNA methylase [uncultured Levyella sp.]|uniref:N-6 DNA methylase n=1 Tax=uncultured Levyella sp. TaxID=1715800 RepID=UPI00258C5BBB|nr:N-6 DNA methylase [uncultured Levyella sp.]